MKKIIGVFVLLCAAACLHAQMQGKTLSWDILFLKAAGAGAGQESSPINQIIKMENEERFHVIITPASDCYCYVVLYDSERQMMVVYQDPIKGGAEVVIGPFEIEDPPGTETFYVIMTLERQAKLENLIRQFKADASQQNANSLRSEVVGLQKKVSQMGEPASAVVPGGGTYKSAAQSNQEYATRFTDKNMYVRTITIRH